MASKKAGGEDSDQLVIRPLGAGMEVGRSCIMLEFKGKKVMLDCGIHPGRQGMDALPFFDPIDPRQIDMLIISHFHLDHCGALPYFLKNTDFKGKVYMTHATKAIYRWLLADFIKVSHLATEDMLFTEADVEATMSRIETIDFHQEVEERGVRFWCYQAGHVLGAAMIMLEIAGVRVLYTGDFSRQEDRHLMSAEMPSVTPHVCIMESTYGTHVHDSREEREARFTTLVEQIVNRGGRCLIPVFALGRAQELLLILDEYWGKHPELQDIPVYYASTLAKKCMAIYQTYIHAMNEKIRSRIGVNNPFQFKYISNLKTIDEFDDYGPCVVLASPGMLQSGLSRELFENWCTDARNGTIIAGYCVEGTLAKQILQSPDEIISTSGQRLPLKCSVSYISFSAHTDYHQTSDFLHQLQPAHCVLVHGEQNEMTRLKAALARGYEDQEQKVHFYTPRNGQSVEFHFRGEKVAKVMNTLADLPPHQDQQLSGILVKKNFSYQIIAPEDLEATTGLTAATVLQKQALHCTQSLSTLISQISRLSSEVVVEEDNESFTVFGCVKVSLAGRLATVEWLASPLADMYSDIVLNVLLNSELHGKKLANQPAQQKVDRAHFRECLLEMLTEMFGDAAVGKLIKGDKVELVVDKKIALINLEDLTVECSEDAGLRQMLSTAVTQLHAAIMPVRTFFCH